LSLTVEIFITSLYRVRVQTAASYLLASTMYEQSVHTAQFVAALFGRTKDQKIHLTAGNN